VLAQYAVDMKGSGDSSGRSNDATLWPLDVYVKYSFTIAYQILTHDSLLWMSSLAHANHNATSKIFTCGGASLITVVVVLVLGARTVCLPNWHVAHFRGSRSPFLAADVAKTPVQSRNCNRQISSR
jgi:hypothetical protein